jgi:hypothetical protein
VGGGINLAELREIFDNGKLHLAVGKIEQLEVAADRSVLRCMILVLPDDIRMVASMSWEAVGPSAGIFQFPSVNDLVVVGYLDGHENEAFVLKRLTSKEDNIPIQAIDGHTVVKALDGKKAFLNSNTEINLTREGPGNERIVLGDTFKAAYSLDLDRTANHLHIGNLGYYTAVPHNRPDFVALKASPVDDNLMLSDLSKTEK